MAKFGETLKRERELREISLRQISEATKINIRYLEALEENRFGDLPGGLFNKGFIRAYANFVGIDGESMVNSYLQDMKGPGPGGDPPAGVDTAKLHRPAEVPQRRAGPAAGAATGGASGGARPVRAVNVSAAPAAKSVASAERSSNLLKALAERASAEPARSAAAKSDTAGHAATGPAPSRVLAWVLSMVALAGILFLIAMMTREPGRPPAEGHGATPAGQEAQPSASPSVEPGIEHAIEPVAEPTPANDATVIPEVDSETPLALSTLAPPERRPTPVPVRTTAPTPTPKSQAIAQAPATERAQPPQPPVEPPAPREIARGPVSMDVAVEALYKTYVVLSCDGREAVNRTMGAGETAAAHCGSVIRVSVTDAAAVHLSVNGASCLALGDAGTRVFGYTIRVDDFSRICPPSGGGGGGGGRGARGGRAERGAADVDGAGENAHGPEGRAPQRQGGPGGGR